MAFPSSLLPKIYALTSTALLDDISSELNMHSVSFLISHRAMFVHMRMHIAHTRMVTIAVFIYYNE